MAIKAKFTDNEFADDLQAYRRYKKSARNTTIFRHAEKCQANLHDWGGANLVTFDPSKESITIISRNEPAGPSFKNMGVLFDPQLNMHGAIESLTASAKWKLRTLLRTQRFFKSADLVHLYKARILSFIEYRTAAIYHGSASALEQVDKVQSRLLKSAGISMENGILYFGLAPLNARRDMALLGLIHRTVLGLGPGHFAKFFRSTDSVRHTGREHLRRHKNQLESFRKGKYLDILAFSVLGLIDVYNLLPAYIVAETTVQEFQKRLQELLKEMAKEGEHKWELLYSPRQCLFNNRLRQLHDWRGLVTNGEKNDDDTRPATTMKITRLFAF